MEKDFPHSGLWGRGRDKEVGEGEIREAAAACGASGDADLLGHQGDANMLNVVNFPFPRTPIM